MQEHVSRRALREPDARAMTFLWIATLVLLAALVVVGIIFVVDLDFLSRRVDELERWAGKRLKETEEE